MMMTMGGGGGGGGGGGHVLINTPCSVTEGHHSGRACDFTGVAQAWSQKGVKGGFYVGTHTQLSTLHLRGRDEKLPVLLDLRYSTMVVLCSLEHRQKGGACVGDHPVLIISPFTNYRI